MSGLHQTLEQALEHQRYAQSQAPIGLGNLWQEPMNNSLNVAIQQAPGDQLLSATAQRSHAQLHTITELTHLVSIIADRVFGPVPQPAGAPTVGHGNSEDRVMAAMEHIERGQFLIDEALQSLRLNIMRLERL